MTVINLSNMPYVAFLGIKHCIGLNALQGIQNKPKNLSYNDLAVRLKPYGMPCQF